MVTGALGATPASLRVARLVCRSSLKRDRRELTARVQNWRNCNSTALAWRLKTDRVTAETWWQGLWGDSGEFAGGASLLSSLKRDRRKLTARVLNGLIFFRLELKSRQGVPGGGRHGRTLTGEAGRAPLEKRDKNLKSRDFPAAGGIAARWPSSCPGKLAKEANGFSCMSCLISVWVSFHSLTPFFAFTRFSTGESALVFFLQRLETTGGNWLTGTNCSSTAWVSMIATNWLHGSWNMMTGGWPG